MRPVLAVCVVLVIGADCTGSSSSAPSTNASTNTSELPTSAHSPATTTTVTTTPTIQLTSVDRAAILASAAARRAGNGHINRGAVPRFERIEVIDVVGETDADATITFGPPATPLTAAELAAITAALAPSKVTFVPIT